MIDVNKFKKAFPNNKEPEILCNLLENMLPMYGIDTKERIAMFIAQCGHESNGFTVLSENLNYSTNGLLSVFSKYFDKDSAEKYARKPEMIANKVYANRIGNGSEASGDGWKYRGFGFIQITGKSNYEAFSKDTGIDIVSNPENIRQDLILAIKTAIWFWDKNNLNKYCDNNDFKGLTKRINGGLNGLEDRQDKLNKLMS